MSVGYGQPLPRPRHERPDMSVCSGCQLFQEKTSREPQGRSVRNARWTYVGRPPLNAHRTCCWFQTAEGRAASSDERLSVMLYGANGGRGCTVRRAS
jgi:hypothetical protein